jgi:putative peptidoglycan lipid II flippase
VATVFAFATTFVQQILYARVLGVGPAADVLAIALTWGIGVSGLIGTSFAGVVIPAYLRKTRDGNAGAKSFFRSANFIALAIAGAGAAITVVLARVLADLALPTSADATRDDLASILRLMAPLILLWTAVATAVALANARQHYILAASSAISPSIPIIAVLVAANPSIDVIVLAYIAGAIVQLIWLGYGLRRELSEFMPTISFEALPVIGVPAGAMSLGLLLISLSAVIARSIASMGGPGDVAVFDYGSRIATAVEQLALTGLLSVALTTWSLHGTGDEGPLPLERTLNFVAGGTVLMTMALAVTSSGLVDAIFRGGNFTTADAAAVGLIIVAIAPGIAAHMVLMVGARALQARGSTAFFIEIGLIVVALMAVGGTLLRPALGGIGVGVAYSVGWVVACAVVLWRASLSGSSWRALLREVLLAMTASAVAALFVVAIRSLIASPQPAAFASALGFVVAAIVSGWLLRIEVIRASWAFVRQWIVLRT